MKRKIWEKNSGLIFLKRIEATRRQKERTFNPHYIFFKLPMLCFALDKSSCTFGISLHARKTEKRTIVNRHLGGFTAQETIVQCFSDSCQKIFYCDDLDHLVAPRAVSLEID